MTTRSAPNSPGPHADIERARAGVERARAELAAASKHCFFATGLIWFLFVLRRHRYRR